MPSTTSTRKRKGAGNIQKKANGSYLGLHRITGYDTYYYTGTSEKDVQKNLNEFYEKTQRQEIIARKETVNTYIERWLENVKRHTMKPASYDRLERTYNRSDQAFSGRSQSVRKPYQHGNTSINQFIHIIVSLFNSKEGL